MMKILIELDEEKINREGKYNLEKMKGYIDSLFEKRNMFKDDENWYSDGNFTSCGSFIAIITEHDYFMENISKFLWYDSSDNSIEDVLSQYKETVCVSPRVQLSKRGPKL